MPARAKNGRFTSTSRRRRRTTTTRASQPRRRSKPKVSLLNVVEQAIVANATTNWLFDTNLPTFLTGRNIAGGFGANGVNNSWEITIPELFNLALGGKGGISAKSYPDGISGVIKRNVMANTVRQGAVILGTPIVFKFAKQVLSKPVIRPANKILKSVGIKEVKL